MHAERDIVQQFRPSVCPSHSGIVAKRMQTLANSFHDLELVGA